MRRLLTLKVIGVALIGSHSFLGSFILPNSAQAQPFYARLPIPNTNRTFLACSDTVFNNSVSNSSALAASVKSADVNSSQFSNFVSSEVKAKSGDEYWHARITSVLHDLVGDDSQAYLSFTPEFKIVADPLPNAYAKKPRQIVISRTLLNLIADESELAFIIGHEMAHLLLNHHSSARHFINDRNALEADEKEADVLALKLMEAAKMDTQAGARLLLKIASFENGAAGPAELFPGLYQRVLALEAANRRSFIVR